ncbi:c-type cytochrome biogenesis protein CcsB [Ideonella sp. 4Y16]|uniref:C-type cytochrome biogenesis protein CcsB n=1 Tax=Ideonella alba TaxID=2824118 RepID=A0A940YCW2_9BURK|nr:c-type cytochrome biogenesis protein CcsB [Ideonella alba]MBQ0932320.1 c-type cytochrome biogenesis protein CcsB [Ideonella alba]MBQ0944470.1 c-type cytochrome biogenesis protein CcsB [Ideonella alba]
MTTTTLDLGKPGLLSGRSAFDWLFAALLLLGAGYAWQRYGASMDGYERGILVGSVPALVALGWFWRPLRGLSLAVGATVLLAISLYLRQTDAFGADLAAAEQVFWLKYLLSSQSAILWMSTLFFMATLFYWIGFFARGDDNAALRIGSRLTWAAVFMALVGTFVRWFESHQIAPDIGHIPVSNLYEVFVLFAWLTALFYLYYEAHYQVRTLGGFVMLVISASVAFLLWYTVAREAHEIQPLVPALQSWWMKLHVPANFIGYGTFALAAMVSLAYLLKTATPRALWTGLVWVPGGVLLAVLAGLALGPAELAPALKKSATLLGGLMALFGLMVAVRGTVNARTPSLELMDDVMYKAIAVGFAFFTIATVLGAFWAAEAWGGYWSWDPKETWALIVWLNYAAWLHMRLMKGLRGHAAAWWSLGGLVVTTFAFLGVNMFLSGLHSYGTL